jgi:hypothetical protein
MLDGSPVLLLADEPLDSAALVRARLSAGAPLTDIAFVAPEVLAGAPATPASDVYAFAASVYALCTRAAPFGAFETWHACSRRNPHGPPATRCWVQCC